MLFPTFEFFTFFTIVLILNWSLKRWPLIWRLFLLLASYYFYSIWDFRFLVILISVSIFNFFSGNLISRNFLNAKKLTLALVILFNLLVLGLFKYYDFFRVSAESLLERAGFIATLPFLEIILPIGLSFYIFRVISYNIDIYSQKIPVASGALDFFIYVSFFPQLLSGPIARAGDFLPQLADGGAKKIENLYENFTLIFLGLFKKLVISSYLVLNIADDVFAVPENHSSLILLLAVFAYSLVIYFDFSGYSDMAVGFAGLMGFRSPLNFGFPYLATNIKDFWRRWHISLSFWIRDYIYIPLGGNRKGKIRKYFNIMAAMLLAGLWHGAATHFLIWGGIHGAGLAINHFFSDMKRTSISLKGKAANLDKTSGIAQNIFWWLITFNFVSFAWIFFRAESTERALIFIRKIFTSENLVEPFQAYIAVFVIVGILYFLLEKQINKGFINVQKKLPIMVWFVFIIAGMILLFKLSPDTLPPFIYFGF